MIANKRLEAFGEKTNKKTKTKTKKHYYLKRELAKLDLLALKKSGTSMESTVCVFGDPLHH